jgi:hypothetical protein
LYHMAIDYTDEEIRQMYTDLLHNTAQSRLWNLENEEKIINGDLEVVLPSGYFMSEKHPNFHDFVTLWNDKFDDVLVQIYESSDQFVSPYKRLVTINTSSSNNRFNFIFYSSIGEVWQGKAKIEKLLSMDIDFIREQVIIYLLQYEIELDALKEIGIPNERPEDLKVK